MGKWKRRELLALADPLVAPVNHALFGGKLGFLMYPQAENANGRYDALDPDHFRYTITARELTA